MVNPILPCCASYVFLSSMSTVPNSSLQGHCVLGSAVFSCFLISAGCDTKYQIRCSQNKGLRSPICYVYLLFLMSVKVLVLFASSVVYLVLSRVWFGGWTFQMFQMMEAEVHVPTM